MKAFRFALVVTILTATVAFPTPQEVQPVAETKDQDAHVPMVQKIEIHVEVKAVPSDMKMPAMVTVTEVKEHVEKSTEAVKSVDAEDPEVAKSVDVKSSESVESSESVKPVEVAKSVESVKPSEDTIEAKTVQEEPKVDETKTKAEDVKNVEIIEKAPEKTEEVKPVIKSVPEETDQLVEATSMPKAAIIEIPMVKTAESKPEKIEAKIEATEPVQVEAKAAETVKPKANDDSDEDKSSEESTTDMLMKLTGETVKASMVITFDEAVKETAMDSTKGQVTTLMPEAQADEITKVDKEVKSVESKPEAKSISNEKLVPIVEDLPTEKQSVEAEPAYRTIPVAVVHDDPLLEEIKVALKTAEIVERTEEQKEEISAVKLTEPTTVKHDVEQPTVQDVAESTTVGEVQKDDAPNVKAVAAVQTEETVEAKSESSQTPNVLVVEAVKAIDVKELEPTLENTAEPTKETKAAEAAKQEGSSTKAVPSEIEKTEQKVEDSSVSSSTAVKLTEDLMKASEVTEKVEEVTTEEATTTTTTTTTTTPVKVEGKKGKKKLPANFRGYSKRLQQVQRKAH